MTLLTIPPTFDGRRTIPSLEVTRLMLEMLDLGPKDKLLEVGTGSAYQTKMFAMTGAEVHSIELEPFVDAINLDGCTPIYLHTGNGALGLDSEAPFTAIVATCGVKSIPRTWRDQLAPGGRLVAPIGDAKIQSLTLFEKHVDELIPKQTKAYVRFQMLRGNV